MTSTGKYMQGKIIQLAWPVVLEGFGVMAVNVAVTAMVGQLGAVALGAVGLATVVQVSTTLIFGAAGTGAAAIVARETGAGNHDEVRVVAGQALLIGAILGTLLSLVGTFTASSLLAVTGAEREVVELSGGVLEILFGFTPFLLIMAIGNNILRGTGQTRVALCITLFSNVMAFCVSYMLTFGRGLPCLGAYGPAWGIGLSQLVGGITAAIVLFFNHRVRLSWRNIFCYRHETITRILKISIPAGLEQLSMQGGRLVFTFMLAGVGAVQFAGNQIANQVESISFMPGFGFSVAAMTLVGQYLGKGMPHRAVQYARLTAKLAFWGMTAMGVVIFIFAKPLAAFFIQDEQAIYWGTLCVMIAVLEQPTIALNYVFGGALRGAGDTKWPMYITTVGVWLVRMPLIYLFLVVWKYDITAAWYITAGDFLVRSFIMWRRFVSNKWQST